MRRTCVVPGSFDPVTNGHLHVIEEASFVFDVVVVAVLQNTSKAGMFTVPERLQLLELACSGLTQSEIRIMSWDGLLIGLLDAVEADIIVRGIRDGRDTDSERQIASVNAELRPGTRTIWVGAGTKHWAVSSTIVRELITFSADISPFVPPEVAKRIYELRSG